MDKQCLQCQKVYQAKRATSKYCSDTCRKQANRGVEADLDRPIEVSEVLPYAVELGKFHADHYHAYKGKNKYFVGRRLCNECEAEIDVENEWSHSACWKTQEEIEQHYTLANFPNITYHSAGGGGSGTISPPKYR